MAGGQLHKLYSITTDGAPAMKGQHKGLRGRLIAELPHLQHCHCFLHEQVLCAKNLPCKETLNKVVQLINKLRGGNNAQTHRKLKEFLRAKGAQFPDLKLHTEIRCLSKGQAIGRFFSLRKEVCRFFEEVMVRNYTVCDKTYII